MLRQIWCFLSIASIALASVAAHAEDAPKKDEATSDKPKTPPDGLSIAINTQGTFALTDMSNVVGQQSGTTVNFGLKFDSGIKYRKEKHQTSAGFDLQTGITQTPLLAGFVKTADNANIGITHFYNVRDWIAPGVGLKVNAPILRGFDLRPTVTTYRIQNADGTTDTTQTNNFTLTRPFFPLTISEQAGLHFIPVTSEKISVDATVGIAGRQTFASGQYIIADNDGTPEIEVKELKDFVLVGGLLTVEMGGTLFDKSLTYAAQALVLPPFWLEGGIAGPDASLLDQTIIDFGVTVGFKLSSFATLDYQLSVMRQPQLTDQWQTRHGLMLSLGANYKKAPPTPKQEAAKDTTQAGAVRVQKTLDTAAPPN